jgi:hypothetical protein
MGGIFLALGMGLAAAGLVNAAAIAFGSWSSLQEPGVPTKMEGAM